MIRAVVLLFKLQDLASLKTNTRMIYATIKFKAHMMALASSVKATSIQLINIWMIRLNSFTSIMVKRVRTITIPSTE